MVTNLLTLSMDIIHQRIIGVSAGFAVSDNLVTLLRHEKRRNRKDVTKTVSQK